MPINWLNLREDQPPKVRQAITKLESRGLKFGSHFGTSNAVSILAEMEVALKAGILYEWLQDRCGVISVEPKK